MTTNPNVLGLIAGNGVFPIHLAEHASKQGTSVFIVALKEEASPELSKWATDLTWISIGQLQSVIDYFQSKSVSNAIMAGQVKHVQLFKGIEPDWRAVKLLAKVHSKKAEDILRGVTDEFAKEGISFLPSVKYLEHWLAGSGTLTNRPLTEQEQKDIIFGKALARQVADADIGQTIVVKDQTVVAIEAMEGTDATIRRAGEIAGPGCVVVKVARSKQDLRFDVPVIGEKTIQSIAHAQATVLAIESHKTLLLEKPSLLKQAQEANLSVVGFTF